MILVVDDDGALLETVREILAEAGYDVEAFTDPKAALERVRGRRPELVLCDVRMPGMDGFAFQRAFAELADGVPFVFLSSVADPEAQIRGLDEGAVDYLTKPIDFRLLVAKVRALLRRDEGRSGRTFVGDLSKMPLLDILRFCEKRGLTGHVTVQGSGVVVRLKVQGGQLVEDEETMEGLDQALSVEQGTFEIEVAAPDFTELEPARASTQDEGRPTKVPCPVGQLSGFRLGAKFVQIQTECASSPRPTVVSVALVDGRVVARNEERVPDGASRQEIGEIIRQRHTQFEQRVFQRFQRGRQAELDDHDGAQGTEQEARRLFDLGLEAVRRRDFEAALESWSRAAALDPSNRILQANLAMLRRKLGKEDE